MTKEDIYYCKTMSPQYAGVVEQNEENLMSWYSDDDKQDEIRKEIESITEFLKSNYGLIDKNKEISVYTPKDVSKPHYINGARYELDDIRQEIIGEIFIGFMTPRHIGFGDYIYPYYIYRTEIDKIPIDKIPYNPVEIYTRFRIEIVELSEALGLKMNKIEHIKENIYTEPIFYQRQEKVDLNSFKRFVEDITYIGKKDTFPLRVPRMRWYSGCKKY